MMHIFPYTRRKKNQLPLTIDLMGYNHPQEPIIRSNKFSLFQWIYCIDGRGEFNIRGQKMILSPGQIMLTYPNEPHSYHGITKEWSVHLIGFSGNCCTEILKTLKMQKPGIYHYKNPDLFHVYLEKIVKIQQQTASDANGPKSKTPLNADPYLIDLSKICYDFLIDLAISAQFIGTSVHDSSNEAVKMLISYMEEHFFEPISLDTLAEHVNLSRSYTSELFKKEMRQTLMQYLTNLRISQARIMLNEYPEKKVNEIAYLCGFENPSYFGEVFKKIVGTTPANYRHS